MGVALEDDTAVERRIVAPGKAGTVLNVLRANGETASVIGAVAPAEGEARVSYRGTLDLAL